MSMINGRFYFKLTDAGNLIGEYSNNVAKGIRTESAIRNSFVELKHRDFTGIYTSAWFEPDPTACIAATLSISLKPNCPGQYQLEWTHLEQPRKIFLGEAMLCDGILIGNYWSAR